MYYDTFVVREKKNESICENSSYVFPFAFMTRFAYLLMLQASNLKALEEVLALFTLEIFLRDMAFVFWISRYMSLFSNTDIWPNNGIISIFLIC